MTDAQSAEERNAFDLEDQVRQRLETSGFFPLGWFVEENSRPALLIGNIGSSFWAAFSTSEIFSDGFKNPLDRWTVQIVSPVAENLAAETRYPFGEKLWPFQTYARQATGMKQSPPGLLIHPEFGLWTAFRAVLVFDEKITLPKTAPLVHPCDGCAEKPCLTVCPVDAFTAEGYDYAACKTCLFSDAGTDCILTGCLARNACPVGRNFASRAEHQAFHMAAFI